MARGSFTTSNHFLLNSGLVTAVPLTMACWINPSSLASSLQVLGLNVHAAATSSGYLLRLENTGQARARAVELGVGDNVDTATTALTVGTWGHIAAVFIATNSRYAYLNGVASAENTVSRTVTAPTSTSIGVRYTNSAAADAAAGFIAEPAFWNVALTAAEILQLAAGYSPLFVRPESLIAYPGLIRGDSSGNEPDRVGGFTFVEQGTVGVQTHPRVFYPSSPIKLGVPAAAPPAGNPWYAWAQM